MSPRLGGEDIWACDAYDEAANHLKLVYPEGEIDFIVAAPITDLASEPMTIPEAQGSAGGHSVQIEVEHPVEIALKKLIYRGGSLKVRDIFDIAVVDELHHDLLHANLHYASAMKQDILKRLASLSEDYCRQELAELDIDKEWLHIADTCLARTKTIIGSIPGRIICECSLKQNGGLFGPRLLFTPASSPAKAGDPVNANAVLRHRARRLLDVPPTLGMTA